MKKFCSNTINLFILIMITSGVVFTTISCSKKKTLLKSDDLRESNNNLSGSWFYKGDWAFEQLWVSFPNEKGDRIIYYFSQDSETNELLEPYYLGKINNSSFKRGKDPFGDNCLKIIPIENLEGSSWLVESFYVMDGYNYLPGYQLRNRIHDEMFGEGFEKDRYTEDGLNVDLYEFENALQWGKLHKK